MKALSLIIFAGILAVALAAGQFYVPRSYYIIDAEGRESIPVPLRRLTRSIRPYPDPNLVGAHHGAVSAPLLRSLGAPTRR